MVQRTFNLVSGRRPPLGVVVFDDGATFNLDGGYVLGREPGHDEAVRSGRLRPLVERAVQFEMDLMLKYKVMPAALVTPNTIGLKG